MKHEIMTEDDFEEGALEKGDKMAWYVIERRFKICKHCGAQGNELQEYPTCVSFQAFHRGAKLASKRSGR